MASETTRMFRAVVVAGVSLTACQATPPTVEPATNQVEPVKPEPAPVPEPVPVATVEPEPAVQPESAAQPDAATNDAGEPLAAPQSVVVEEKAAAKKGKKMSAKARKKAEEERKRREWEAKFPYIL